MDKISEKIVAIAQEVKDSLYDMNQRNKYEWQKEQAIHEEFIRQQAQINQKQQMYGAMKEISRELFPILQNHSYQNIAQIYRPMDIRIKDYDIKNSQPVYEFELKKISNNPLSNTMLRYMQQDIQECIENYLYDEITMMGFEVVSYLSPFLYNNMRILNIKDMGFGVHLYLTSDFLP